MIGELKPYSAYKDSRVPWLGKVPEHWDMERAKWLFQKMDRPARENDDVVTCFRDGTVTLRKNRRLRGYTEALKEIGYQGVRRGDLVIHAMDAFAGAIGVSDSDGKGTPVYAVCQPQEGVNPFFYSYAVREMARSQWILALAKGIRERSTDFRFDTFASSFVPLPPTEEQAQIATFLDYADCRIRRYIRSKQKLIKLLEEQKQVVINQAVTRGLDPNVPLKPSGIKWLGDIPEHWEVKRVKNVCQVLRGKFTHRPRNDPRFYDGQFPFIQTGDISAAKKYISSYSQTLNDKGFAISKMFPAGTLAMVITGAKTGHVAILGFDACFPDSAVGFLPRDSQADTDFLFYLFISLKNRLDQAAITSTQENLNIERISSQISAWPPIQEQRIIASNLQKQSTAIDEISQHIQTQITFIREFRTRLIADVVTGKLDVREVAAHLPEELDEPELLEDDLLDPDLDPDADSDLEAIAEDEAA